jgi:BirA family transcriptional regulator, biotin operon repressor / biotin---[acetyl-CoA-carboxylase] ligase
MDTLFVGKHTIFLQETESTNRHALKLLKNVNLPEGSVVHAAAQTMGRGQRGSQWHSEAGSSLCASFVLKPSFLSMQDQYFLYKIAALAVAKALQAVLGEDAHAVMIKWPNDILIKGKKAAGILIENQVSEGRMTAAVIGVGLNVNQSSFKLLPNATSLKMTTGKEYPTALLLKQICEWLEKFYIDLKAGRRNHLSSEYKKLLFGLSDRREFIINSEKHMLTVKGVSRRGLLSLEDEHGRRIEADVKEVQWVL